MGQLQGRNIPLPLVFPSPSRHRNNSLVLRGANWNTPDRLGTYVAVPVCIDKIQVRPVPEAERVSEFSPVARAIQPDHRLDGGFAFVSAPCQGQWLGEFEPPAQVVHQRPMMSALDFQYDRYTPLYTNGFTFFLQLSPFPLKFIALRMIRVIELFDVEVLNVGNQVGETPRDPLVMTKNNAGRPNKGISNRFKVTGMKPCGIP